MLSMPITPFALPTEPYQWGKIPVSKAETWIVPEADTTDPDLLTLKTMLVWPAWLSD